MFHGINAYNKETRIYALIERVGNINPRNSVCFADIPIGKIGVYCCVDNVKPHQVDYMATKDVWSYIDWDGRRITDIIYHSDFWSDAGPVMHYPESYDNTHEMFMDVRNKKVGRYIEISAKAEPDCIWVRDNASRKYKLLANVIGRKYGLPVIEVDAKGNMCIC